METTRIYTDASLVHYVPETPAVAGVWSYCAVAPDDSAVVLKTGVVMPKKFSPAAFDSQAVATYAVLVALESMPEGWNGEVLTDCIEAVERLRSLVAWNKRKKLVIPSEGDRILDLAHISPAQSVRYSQALRRLGSIRFTRIAGHPTEQDLALGYKTHRSGEVLSVSRHNVACDQSCHETALRWKEAHPAPVQDLQEPVKPRYESDNAPLTQPLFVWRGTPPAIWPGTPVASRKKSCP